MYSAVAGHVTAGGSICIEALTLSGTAGSWTSQYNVESILNIVILNMIGVFSVPLSVGVSCFYGSLNVRARLLTSCGTSSPFTSAW